MDFYKKYRPLTAAPFRQDAGYAEFEPCEALKPYIRCFWGTYGQPEQGRAHDTLVIPDTCMDIIFRIDDREKRVCGGFCGIDDSSFVSHTKSDNGQRESVFAIRFYAWSVAFFTEDSLKDVKNGFFEVEQYFAGIKREIEPLLLEVTDIRDRIKITEKYLLTHMYHRKNNTVVLQTVDEILKRKGNVDIKLLAEKNGIGTRQLQRLFKEYTGCAPKQLASLIRYQYLWRDILLQRNFDVQDAVYRYGYTDQAHLLHEFKRFHTMTIRDARAYAFGDVAFLQDDKQMV